MSLNAVIGNNGIITNSQIASIETKFARYKEELETNIVSEEEGDGEKVNLLNENVKNYIPSLEENDVGRFAVIGGELYYLGNDELSKKAAQNQKMEVIDSGTETESESSVSSIIEEKAIESMVRNNGENGFKRVDEESGELVEIGEKLVSKNLFSTWKIVNEFDDKTFEKSYGDGWYYIKKGTNIDGLGILKEGYIINFTEDKVIIFDDNKHLFLDSEEKLAVTGNIVLNIDPSSLSDEKTWGDNIKLHGVEDEEKAKFNDGKKLEFDGKDDYLEISGVNSEIMNGVTLEFFGKINSDGECPLLCKTKSDDVDFSKRFRSMVYNNGKFSLCAGSGDCGCVWKIDDSSNKHWINVDFSSAENFVSDFSEDFYLTLVMDLDSSQISIFVNGKKFGTEECDSNWLKSGSLNDKEFPFTLGAKRGGTTTEGTWNYGCFSLYSCRLYTKVLTDKEVNDNYLKTVSFYYAETEE